MTPMSAWRRSIRMRSSFRDIGLSSVPQRYDSMLQPGGDHGLRQFQRFESISRSYRHRPPAANSRKERFMLDPQGLFLDYNMANHPTFTYAPQNAQSFPVA